MTNFEFNLQLFAEGEEASAATNETVAVPAQESTTDTPAAETHEQPQSNDTGAVYLVTDPQTGRKRIVSNTPQASETPEEESGNDDAEQQQPEAEQKQEESTTPEQQTSQQEPQAQPLLHTEPYTLDELNSAIQNNHVDESRIPAQYQVQYAQYRQEQMQRQQQLQQQQQAFAAQQQQQQLEQQKQMFAQIDQAATNQAMQAYGLTQDDIDTAEYSDDEDLKNKVAQYHTAKDYFKGQLINAIQQQQMQTQAAQNEQKAIYASIVDYTRKIQAEEPNFDEINQMMGTYYQSVPYKDAAAVSDAINALNAGNINQAQCKVLEGYYNQCRTAYYAKKNDLTKTPKKVPVPKVEQPGNGAKSQPKPFDFTQLRNMTERERRAAMAQYWHSGK